MILPRNSPWSVAQCFLEKTSTSTKPVKPGLLDPGADLPQIDAALTGQPTVQQQILGRRLPVADVIREQGPGLAAALDLGLQRRIPPQVIHVHGDADVGRRDGLGQIVGLAHGADGRAIVGVHRMQRFDGQLDVVGLRVRQHRLDAGANLIARLGQRLPGHGATDQHDHRGAQRGGFVDGAAVVIEGLFAAGLIAVGEKTTPAQRHDGQPVLAQHLSRALRALRPDGVAPDRDAFDPGGGIRGGGLLDGPRLGGDGVDATPIKSGQRRDWARVRSKG